MDTKRMNSERLWTNFIAETPEIGKPFIALWNDGSGGQCFKRINKEEVIDCDGDTSSLIDDFPEHGFIEWAYLPDDFKFWYELKGK